MAHWDAEKSHRRRTFEGNQEALAKAKQRKKGKRAQQTAPVTPKVPGTVAAPAPSEWRDDF